MKEKDVNNELKEILFDDAQVVEFCNTISTIAEFYIILQKINWMNKSCKLYLEMYRDGYAIKNKDSGTFSWTKKGLNYFIEIINSEYGLSNHLNIEFINAKNSILIGSDDDPKISRELSVELFKRSKKKLIYNDESYTVFTFDRFGILLRKFNGIADECYFRNDKITTYYDNKDDLDNYFYGNYDDSYEEPDYDEPEDYDTVNGKVYLSDGVWIDKKDKWW